MTKATLRAKDIYMELKQLLVEARKAGLEKFESYRRLVDALDDVAAALHRMLYVDEKLDPEAEEAIKSALSFTELEMERI